MNSLSHGPEAIITQAGTLCNLSDPRPKACQATQNRGTRDVQTVSRPQFSGYLCQTRTYLTCIESRLMPVSAVAPPLLRMMNIGELVIPVVIEPTLTPS